MGSSKNKSKETKKAGGTPKSAKKPEKEKSEPPKSGKKGASEPKELKALIGKKRWEPEAVATPPYQPETSELEKKRLQVSEELRKVETRIGLNPSISLSFPIEHCHQVCRKNPSLLINHC